MKAEKLLERITLNPDVMTGKPVIRGADDREVIQKACEQNRILITNDKDFGELVFREKNQIKV